jgi:hypothetical protein
MVCVEITIVEILCNGESSSELGDFTGLCRCDVVVGVH